MELLYAPGESADQIVVHIPSMRAIAAADLVYKAFPNVYSLRGSDPRPVDEWFKSIDKVYLPYFLFYTYLICCCLYIMGSLLITFLQILYSQNENDMHTLFYFYFIL